MLEGAVPGCVYDSRTGAEVEYKLSAVAQRMLEVLERPAGMADLARALGDVPGDELGHELELLLNRGLLFEEHGRYLNLVVM